MDFAGPPSADEVQVARIKLREIKKLRGRQQEKFQQARAEVLQRPDDQIEILYNALCNQDDEAGFNVQVADLKGLFEQKKYEKLPAELLDGLKASLNERMATAEKRREAVFLYANMLEEYLTATVNGEVPDLDPTEEEKELRAAALKLGVKCVDPAAAREKAVDFEFVNNTIKMFEGPKEMEQMAESMLKKMAELTTQRVTEHELTAAMVSLKKERLIGEVDSRRLDAIINDKQVAKEYCGLLQLLVQDFANWECPEEGFAIIPIVFENAILRRVRCVVKPDLITMLFFHVVGTRLCAKSKEKLCELYDNFSGFKEVGSRSSSKAYLACTGTQEKYIRYSLLEEAKHLLAAVVNRVDQTTKFAYGREDPGGESPPPIEQFKTLNVIMRRHMGIKELKDAPKPLTVVCADVKDLGHSVSHKLILDVAAKLKFPEALIGFFKKFLEMRVWPESSELQFKGPVAITHGVMVGHCLSRYLVELVLLLVDTHVRKETGVWLCRYHDDIMFWHEDPCVAEKAYFALEEALAKLGLELNKKKCGCTQVTPPGCTAPAVPAGLPMERPFSWRMLDLATDGKWGVSAERYGMFKRKVAASIAACGSTLMAIQVYNNATWSLAENLGPALIARGADHWERVVMTTATDFHCNTFAAGGPAAKGPTDSSQGILAKLRSDISKKFKIPPSVMVEAWFYWPLTAGGLALENPILHAMPMLFGLRDGVEGFWKMVSGDHYPYYNPYEPFDTHRIPEVAPASGAQLKSWTKEFNSRRNDLFGSDDDPQKELRCYWQWMISTYGDQIQKAYASFNFLNKEFVSIVLVRRLRALAE